MTNAAQPHGAVSNGVPTASEGEVFAQLLAALGQSSADASVPALLASVDPNVAKASPGRPADHLASDPPAPGQTLRSLLAELHASDGKPDNPGEVVSDAAKLLTKDQPAATTPDRDKDVPDDDPKPASDPGALLTQLLAAAPPAPSTPHAIRPAASESANTNQPAPSPDNILAAVQSDVIASGIGQNARQTRQAREPKRDETAATPDSAKSQSSTTNALAALSTTAGQTFSDNPPPAIHTDAGAHNSNSSGSNDLPNNPHARAAAPVSDVRVAPQATFADGSTPTNPPPQSDNNAQAAANGAAPSPQPPDVPPAQFHANLQVGHAPAHAAPDIGALAVSIAARSQDGIKYFDIRLDPPDLGKVDVRLTVDDAGKAQASLAVEKPQTLELLQRDSSTLERALKDAGLDLSQNGLNFSLKGQQHQASGENAPSPRGRALHVRAVAAIDQPAPTLSSSGAVGEPRLDIRV